MNQYLKDKKEKLEELGIDISSLPLGVKIKDIEIGQDDLTGRFYAVVSYFEDDDKEKENSETFHQEYDDIEDIFR